MENLKLDKKEFLKMAGISGLSTITGITLTGCSENKTIDVTNLNNYKIYTYKLNDDTTNVIIAKTGYNIFRAYSVWKLAITDESLIFTAKINKMFKNNEFFLKFPYKLDNEYG